MSTIRIIHIVENMDKGAVENWLLRMFLEVQKVRPNWEWTFYCILNKKGRLDEKVKAAGGRIVCSPITLSNKIAFLRHFRETVKKGNFDIVHAHHDYLSGFYLSALVGLKIPLKLLHVHNADKSLPVGSKRVNRLLLRPFAQLAYIFTDKVIGISHHVLKEFSKSTWLKFGSQDAVHYYGIYLEKNTDFEEENIRISLSLPQKAPLLLFAGRLNAEKNPLFAVKVIKQLKEQLRDAVLLIVGEGHLLSEIHSFCERNQLHNNIRVLGWRNDLPCLMKQCDLFLFPRLLEPKEGLGLVVVEAQAAGLPVLTSKGILNDAVILKENVIRMEKVQDEKVWAETALQLLKKGRNKDYEQKMEESFFAMPNAVAHFLSLYEDK